MISSCPKVEGNELYSCPYMHPQLGSLNDYAESLKLITFLIFQVTENCKSLSEKMENIGLHAVIHHLNLTGSPGGAIMDMQAIQRGRWDAEVKHGRGRQQKCEYVHLLSQC